MKVDTMRAIDYYAGVPLCFLMTVLFWLTKPFRNSSSGAPRKVVFIELSEMGSAIIVDPAMRKMQAHGALRSISSRRGTPAWSSRSSTACRW